MRKDLWSKRAFIVPAVAVAFCVTIFPFFHTVVLSFTNAQFFRHTATRFVGLENWARVFTDRQLRLVLGNTLFFVLGGLACQYPIGLLLALGLSRTRILGSRFLRQAFLIPMLISPIAAGFIVGRMMFNETIGPINDILIRIGLSPIPWLSMSWTARTVMVLIDSWQWIPFFTLFLLAGIESLPEEPIEAARVDGANSWQIFRYVIFPQLIPTSVITLLIRGLMIIRTVDIPRIVTAGGPGSATETITMYAYDTGVRGGNIAYGATIAITMFVIIVVAVSVFLLLIRRSSSEVKI